MRSNVDTLDDFKVSVLLVQIAYFQDWSVCHVTLWRVGSKMERRMTAKLGVMQCGKRRNLSEPVR